MRLPKRILSTTALGLAIAGLSVTAAPAAAQKKGEKAQGPKYDLSKPVREALAPYDKAMTAKDFATAKSAVDAAVAVATTADDKYIVNRYAFDVANATKDDAALYPAMEGVLASGKSPPKEAAVFNGALAVRSYNDKRNEDALRFAAAAKAAGSTDANLDVVIAETYGRQKDYPKAIAAFQGQIDAETAAGRKADENVYRRVVGYAQQSKDPALLDRTSQQWVAAYPTPESWRIVLTNAMVDRNYNEGVQLDFLRLMKLSGGLTSPSDYRSYAELAAYGNLNGEVISAVDAGTGAGLLNQADVADVYGKAKAKSAEDRRSLTTEFKAASSKSDAKPVAAAADALFGYGSYDEAIELYKIALTKNGVNADEVTLRMGIAQAMKGDLAAAKGSFAKVKGERQPLATYWTVWANSQA